MLGYVDELMEEKVALYNGEIDQISVDTPFRSERTPLKEGVEPYYGRNALKGSGDPL